jgi:hypothetical protein
MSDERTTYTAFVGDEAVSAGTVETVLRVIKARYDERRPELVLVFDDATGRQVDFDLGGTPQEVLDRASAPPPRPGPGRPRLGVVSREVSLLPRHWEWLEAQPNGISAALRRLVDDARKRDPAGERARLAREAAYRVMAALAGNRPRFEEAARALFAGEPRRVEELAAGWPPDVRRYVGRFIAAAGEAVGTDAGDLASRT